MKTPARSSAGDGWDQTGNAGGRPGADCTPPDPSRSILPPADSRAEAEQLLARWIRERLPTATHDELARFRRIKNRVYKHPPEHSDRGMPGLVRDLRAMLTGANSLDERQPT